MNKTKIEWCDYTINPIKGLCPVDCKDNQGKSYCYARAMYKRFKWNPEIRFEGVVNLSVELLRIKQPSKIFVGSTMELFGDWIDSHWMDIIFEATRLYSQHTFIFLTKQPQNLTKWSPFPDNCWVGVSATETRMALEACLKLGDIEASVRFLSLEPMLHSINLPYTLLETCHIDWIIIGAQTPYNQKTAPKLSWVQEILVAASNADNIPVFMKNNLQPVIDHDSLWAGWRLRQEFPHA